jgi:5-methylcytosine-specific restriction endonuclease McrBC regulatory subunit McrC
MEKVFEKAIANFLGGRLPEITCQSGRTYRPISGTPGPSLSYAADIVVGAPPHLVIDTKYAPPEVRNQYGGWSLHNEHVYQVVFYALSLGCPALLVYPRAHRDVEVSFDIEGIRVSILTVDLREQGLKGLDKLAEAVAGLCNIHAAA